MRYAIDCRKSNGDLADFMKAVLCVLDLSDLNSLSNCNLLFFNDANNENRGRGGKRGNDVFTSMSQQRRLFLYNTVETPETFNELFTQCTLFLEPYKNLHHLDNKNKL
jgi:hypothetical protein